MKFSRLFIMLFCVSVFTSLEAYEPIVTSKESLIDRDSISDDSLYKELGEIVFVQDNIVREGNTDHITITKSMRRNATKASDLLAHVSRDYSAIR